MKHSSTLASPFSAGITPSGTIAQRALHSLAGGAVERLLALRQLDAIYAESVSAPGLVSFADGVLNALGVSLDLPDSDRLRIPATGGSVVVANHPYGAIEGIAILSILLAVRSDVRIMANTLLDRIPALREHSIFVDPFGGNGSARENVRGIRQAIEWVRGGGMLVIFPAGEVSHITLREPRAVDPEWSATTARIIRRSAVGALPVYFDGCNRPLFQIMGLIHPRLRTVMLPRELLQRRGKTLQVRVGAPIPFARLRELSSDAEMTRYLRDRTYFLAHRVPGRPFPAGPLRTGGKPEPIVPAADADILAREIGDLPPSQTLLTHGDYLVAYAHAASIPFVLREIGRLRELAFRAAGEGTGCAIDLDRFDQHYEHLFLWNRRSREIVGAYRMGRADEIVESYGTAGLYTSTLFRYRDGLLPRLGKALELGRSFVAPAHQKSFNALPLLWKGIGGYLLRHPEYRTLFGPVSISGDYTPASRELMATFLQRHRADPELVPLVRSRTPFAIRGSFNGAPMLPASAGTLDDLAALVGEMERGERSVPVLLRQYLKLGGRLLGLNVDRQFHDVLDALIAVDLTRTEPAVLARYMGEEGAGRFLRYHNRPSHGAASPAPAMRGRSLPS